ncbi:MAG: hypothetical protein K6G75_04250 [Lachnospiraceae bacterium]|nr:hypothetical protein [Lachnospiraceae bacterium]
MNIKRHKNTEKILAGIFAIIMLVSFMFSYLFMSLESNHYIHCEDDDCSVCVCLHQCENYIHGFSGIISLSIVFIPALTVLVLKFLTVCGFSFATPVSMKVRLNN